MTGLLTAPANVKLLWDAFANRQNARKADAQSARWAFYSLRNYVGLMHEGGFEPGSRAEFSE